MANKDTPQGLRPYGEVKQISVEQAGAEVFPGDAVIKAADGQVDPVTAGNDIYGVALTHAAAANDDVNISVAPDQQYVIQANGAEIANQDDMGQNAEILATAGNTTFDQSRMELDSNTLKTSTGQLNIIDIDQRPDNALGLNVDVIVKINEHQIWGENDSAGI